METKLIPSQPFKLDHMLVVIIISVLHPRNSAAEWGAVS